MADKAIPNFSQIPNNTLDSMFMRTPAENLVILFIARKTYGWHKEKDKISLSQIVSATGLSRRGVINSIKSLTKSGWIGSDSDKQGNKFYWIYEKTLVNSVHSPSEHSAPALVNSVHYHQSTECTPPSELSAPTKETVQNKVLNNSLNKGKTHTVSNHSTSDQQTKVSLQKKQDMPLNANYSPSEEILNGIPSQYMPEHSEASQKPNSYYVQIYVDRYKSEHDNEPPYRLDTFALEDLWRQLAYSEEKFDRLVRNFRTDKFWNDKKITVPFLLKYKSICADWNKEPVPAQPKTAYNTRDYNSPEHRAAVENIRKAAENRQNGVTVPFKKKTIKEIMDERKAKEAQEKLKHAV